MPDLTPAEAIDLAYAFLAKTEGLRVQVQAGDTPALTTAQIGVLEPQVHAFYAEVKEMVGDA